jgi:uncharacterized protein YigE (DUF2233 family)
MTTIKCTCVTFLFVVLAHIDYARDTVNYKDRALFHTSADTSRFMPEHLLDSLYKVIIGNAKATTDVNESKLLLNRMNDSVGLTKKMLADITKRNHAEIARFRATTVMAEKLEEDILDGIHKNLSQRDSLLNVKTRLEKNIGEETKNHTLQTKNKETLAPENAVKGLQAFIQKRLDSVATGAYAFTFGNKKIRAYICDNSSDVRVINNSNRSPVSIEAILNKEKTKPDMVTNGGMFDPSYKAVGLLIENNSEKSPVDSMEKPDGNFYLLPNAIFYIDSAKFFHVVETGKFMREVYDVNKKGVSQQVKYATQSGPMLVNEGEINAKLKFYSRNENIRSGVGVMNDGRAVFLISDEPVSFYYFASMFNTLFNCKNAVYLDGAISKMYTKNQSLYKDGNFANGSGGGFGPMISIQKKEK